MSVSSSSSSTKTIYYLSIDGERTGDALGAGVIALGACFGPKDGSWPVHELKRFRGNMKLLPTDKPEDLCMQEFWSRYPEIFKNIKDNERDPAVVLSEFEQWCKNLVQTYEVEQGGKIELVTDCPDADLAQLDFVASQLKGKGLTTPVRYLGGSKRHNCRDPDERFEALGCYADFELWLARTFKEPIVHNHEPENDARYNYYQMVFLHHFGSKYLHPHPEPFETDKKRKRSDDDDV